MTGKAFILAAPFLALALAGASTVMAQAPQDWPPQDRPPQDRPLQDRSLQDRPPRGDSLGADWREQQNEARQKVREGRHVPLDRVIATIRAKTPGRQLDTGLEQGADGRTVYRVRWAAANGRRIDFLVDAQSGAIVGEEGR